MVAAVYYVLHCTDDVLTITSLLVNVGLRCIRSVSTRFQPKVCSCTALLASVIPVQSFNTNCVVGQSFHEQEFIIVEELGRTLISEIPVGKTKQIPKVLIL